MSATGKKKRALGILGGMGPLATVNFYKKIVEMTYTDAEQGHLRIFIDNHPQIPDRISAILDGGEDPLPYMEESVKKLVSCGAGYIVMPCVTAHYFLPRLVPQMDVPFINMIDVAMKKINLYFKHETFGVLSSAATAKSGLVINALRAADIRFVLPTENHQLELGNIILKIKADEISQDTVSCFSEIIEMMHNKGATRFLLACTELPIIARYCENSNAFVDATLELAKEAILSCGYKIRDPGSVLPEKGL